MTIGSGKPNRTSLALGWEAAKANAVPAFILQAAMLLILVSYYLSPACADFLNRLAHYKEEHGLLFVVTAAILAGAIVPELFVIAFFQRGRPRAQNLRNLAFTIPTWGIDGILVDLMYRWNAVWFGDVVTMSVVTAKILVDQLGYNPFIAAPLEVLIYEWKNEGFSWRSVRRALTWDHYRDKIVRPCWRPGRCGRRSWPLFIRCLSRSNSPSSASRSLSGSCS